MLTKIKQNKSGVTLLEMMVAVTIFTVVMLSATKIFQMVIESQRSAIAAQNLQESMRYAFEVMAKEIRMAQKDVGEPDQCPNVGNGKVYKTNPAKNQLNFRNFNEECVKYYLDSDRLKINRDSDSGYITPDEIKVSNLQFEVIDDVGNEQSMVTVKMDIEATGKEMHKQIMKIQTTISLRYYE